MPTLRQLILEEKCPLCGSEGAYVGLRDVECPNRKCKAYSERQALEVDPLGLGSVKQVEFWYGLDNTPSFLVKHASGEQVEYFFDRLGPGEGDVVRAKGGHVDPGLQDLLIGLIDPEDPLDSELEVHGVVSVDGGRVVDWLELERIDHSEEA